MAMELNKRGMNVNPRCWQCEGVAEDIKHSFWSCPLSIKVWMSLLTYFK